MPGRARHGGAGRRDPRHAGLGIRTPTAPVERQSFSGIKFTAVSLTMGRAYQPSLIEGRNSSPTLTMGRNINPELTG